MKTLTDLKRDAASGNMKLEIIERFGKTGSDIPEILRGVRKVTGANTVAIFIANNNGTISDLRFVSAKTVDYDGETLVIYDAQEREPTEQESAILAEWQRIQDQYYEDNPLGDAYYKRKRYFSDSPCPWMDGYETIQGKRYLSHNGKVKDNSLKGEMILKYKVSFDTPRED